MNASGASTRNVQSVETSSGRATSLAPKVRRLLGGRPQPEVAVGVFEADDRAVAQGADSPAPSPASVITLMVLPRRVQARDRRQDGNRGSS